MSEIEDITETVEQQLVEKEKLKTEDVDITNSQDQMKESMRKTFEQHHQEIRRRADINRQGFLDGKIFSKVEDAEQYDFYNEDQKYIVFSLSQEEFSPIPVDLSDPSVCIYGAFPTEEEAKEYAVEVVLQNHPGISILIDQIHNWIVSARIPVI